MKGTKPHLAPNDEAFTKSPAAPSWLSKDAQVEWRRVMPDAVRRRIISPATLAGAEEYCILSGRIREIERQLQLAATIDADLSRLQMNMIDKRRRLGDLYGFDPYSRSRPALRGEAEDADSLVD